MRVDLAIGLTLLSLALGLAIWGRASSREFKIGAWSVLAVMGIAVVLIVVVG